MNCVWTINEASHEKTNRSDMNQSVLSQKKLAVTAKLICAFVFPYVDCWFSYVVAH